MQFNSSFGQIATAVFLALASVSQLSSARAQGFSEQDCRIISVVLDSLARGTTLVVLDSTSTESWTVGDEEWQQATELYGQFWDSSYANWFERNSRHHEIAPDCIESERPVSKVALSDQGGFVFKGDEFSAMRFAEIFPGSVSLLHLTLPGYNQRGNKAIVEVAQLCVGAECGSKWTVLLEKLSDWQIAEVSSFTEY